MKCRVVIDAHHLGSGQGGNETYVREILVSWRQEHSQLIPATSADRLKSLRDDANWAGEVSIIRKGPVNRWTVGLGLAATRSQATVLHTSYFAPLTRPEKFVVTVHDVSFKRFPHWFPAGRAKIFDLAVGHAIAVADRVVAVSNVMAVEIEELYPKASGKIVVAPLGVRMPNVISSAPQYMKIPYLLYVGNLSTRKNLIGAIRAFACSLKFINEQTRLKIVGAGDQTPLLAECHALGISANVDFCGRVDALQLDELYRHAGAIIYVSFYEGFGLPVLEALSYGKPLVASNIDVHREVAGKAAIYVDPHDTDHICSGIVSAMTSGSSINRDGLDRAREFTWAATADSFDSIYRDL